MYAINGGHNLKICSIYNSHKKDEVHKSKLTKKCVISSWRKLYNFIETFKKHLEMEKWTAFMDRIIMY